MAEDLIPIDIQCNKLVDWLIDRRHCNIKWQTSNEVVKQKIANALQDMPNTKEMRELIEGSCFHYFKCCKIVDVLKDTEKDSKNIFGRYSSQRMKDWQEILAMYQKENLHLAELSSRLLRNLNYEIPAVKRQTARCEQVREECRKKIQDCIRNTQEVKRRYATECKKVGIVGINIHKELMALVRDLPQEFDRIAQQCKDLIPVIEYYVAFVAFSLDNDDFASAITPVLKYLSKLGNTTVYQWKHDTTPDKVTREDCFARATEENPVASDGEIDWGSVLDVEAVAVDDSTIDFDIDVGEIGIVLETAGEGGSGNSDDNGFEMVDQDEMQNWELEEVNVADVPNGSKLITDASRIAQGEEAKSVLECIDTRTQFINELMELSAFLCQRIAETKCDVDVLSINQFQSAPPILQLTSVGELESMLGQVVSIHDQLTTTKMTHLCRILDSPRFVDRLAENLVRQLSLTNKYESQIAQHEQRIKASDQEEIDLHPKLALLVKETKEWQTLIEGEISRRYKDRPVHLMGTINML